MEPHYYTAGSFCDERAAQLAPKPKPSRLKQVLRWTLAFWLLPHPHQAPPLLDTSPFN